MERPEAWIAVLLLIGFLTSIVNDSILSLDVTASQNKQKQGIVRIKKNASVINEEWITNENIPNSSSEEKIWNASMANKRTAPKITGYSKALNVTKYMKNETEIESMYGKDIVIVGLEGQCTKYQKLIPGHDRYLAPAGLFNTGTNTLYKLLQRNCYIPQRWEKGHQLFESSSNSTNRKITSTLQDVFTAEKDELFNCLSKKCSKEARLTHDRYTGIRHDVPWWKHGFASFRYDPPYTRQFLFSQLDPSYNSSNVLPIVMIKDPLHWMSSMCRNPYFVHFHRVPHHCPNLSYQATMKLPQQKKHKVTLQYASLLHLWKDYYEKWLMDADEEIEKFPRVMVRYEDLLFHPKEVTEKICHCAGGIMRPDFQGMTKPTKKHGSGVFDKNTRTDAHLAAVIYGNKEIRDIILNDVDLKKARLFFKNDSSLLDLFHYLMP